MILGRIKPSNDWLPKAGAPIGGFIIRSLAMLIIRESRVFQLLLSNPHICSLLVHPYIMHIWGGVHTFVYVYVYTHTHTLYVT